MHFICAFHLVHFILLYPQASAAPWYGGQVHEPNVLRSGKWAVSTALYPDVAYPPYAKGGGYVLSSVAVAAIGEEIRSGRSPLLRNVEDAMIGIAAARLSVRPTSIAGFREVPPDHEQLGATAIARACCSPDTLLYHKPLQMSSCDACTLGIGVHSSTRPARSLEHKNRIYILTTWTFW